MEKLPANTYPVYFDRYINLVNADSITHAAGKYSLAIENFFSDIPSDKATGRYSEGKWSLKELLLHITDTERIFAYRALRIARRDKTPLPGFDENSFAEASNADSRTWESLLEEFKAVRKSTDLLLQSFSDEQLDQMGVTNGQPTTAKAVGFIVYGHLLHHINVVKERYL
jgi:uncharacterized damage-inducible protein DinB